MAKGVWGEGSFRQKKRAKKNAAEEDFPGGPVVKNLSSNAGDVGLIPGWGTKIPHALGQLILCMAMKIQGSQKRMGLVCVYVCMFTGKMGSCDE